MARTLLVLLLAAAAAGLTWHRAADQHFVVLAVDRSKSVDQPGRSRSNQIVQQFRAAVGRNRLALLEFAARPGNMRELIDDEGGIESAQVWTDCDSMGTDLASAIQVARAAIPPGLVPHVVLVSDGLQNVGDALSAAKSSQIPVSTIPLPARQQPEVQVSQVSAPVQVRVGEPFYVEVVLNAYKSEHAELALFRDDLRVNLGDSARLVLGSGENRFRFRQQLDEAQAAVFTARVTAADDTQLDDNSASALVLVAGNPRVLLVDTEPETLDPLRWALEDQKFNVDVVPPNGLPSSLAELISYDAIVLSNVPATALTIAQQEWLRRYVQQLGGGLLMLGSDQSFGLGGYYKTPLEAVLPVRSDMEQEREKPSLAMVLIIDRSGSMGGMKLDLAKDAARGTVELLGPRDQIGVVAFDDDAYWVSPLRSAVDRVTVIDNINRLSAAGGTNLYPAMAQAHSALVSTASKLKHVIVLTDGISAPADFDRLTAKMASDRITVSTVAVGDQPDRKRLQAISQQGGGRYYECNDARSVPQIFAQETIMASKSAIEEEPFFPQQVRASAALRGIDLSTAPMLLGYVVTRPKATSEVILVSEKGDPILAWWRYGLGMSLAFTSDAKSRWAAEWLTWPDYSTFWAQAIRHVMRSSNLQKGHLQVSRSDGVFRVALDLVDDDEAFINQAETGLAVIRPDSPDTENFLMPQSAPGRYEAEFSSPAPGPYFLDVMSRVGGQVVFHQTMGTHIGYPVELRLRPVDTLLLQQIAEQTGGLFEPTADQVFDFTAEQATRAVPIWRSLVALALLCWIADVALRRLAWFQI